MKHVLVKVTAHHVIQKRAGIKHVRGSDLDCAADYTLLYTRPGDRHVAARTRNSHTLPKTFPSRLELDRTLTRASDAAHTKKNNLSRS